jgi:EmrB/QacA subfamily drug resistance transporter
MPGSIQGSHRWLALIVLCLGVLMIVLDSTIVNVALPSIRADLGFSETSLVWVVNAYLLTFGGFLLLGGRLGDLFGSRRLFLIGIVAFTVASLACGIATSQVPLVCARAVQGLGGAVVSAVALSLIMNMFPEPGERAKAMGIYGFVCSGGGSIGVLLGGLLTSTLSWHWIFLVNLPIGIVVYLLCLYLIPATTERRSGQRLDIAGATTVTAALMLAVYAIVNGNEAGWTSKQSIGLLSAALVLLGIFLAIESRIRAPLVPLRLFRSRAISISNIVAVLWAAAMFAWFFISALYLQRVLGYDAMHVGLAFLPANLVMAALSLGLSAKLVMRFGIKIPLATGLLLAALGLALFAGSPLNATLTADVLPGMILLGLGAGIAFNPLLIASMSDVEPSESGLASGLVNTAFMMGGAVGLAILASAAAARTGGLLSEGAPQTVALNGGYHVAFAIGVGCCIVAAILGIALLPSAKTASAPVSETAGTAS